jgi:polysaccharide pyruvyl transferase WcaK-like protein
LKDQRETGHTSDRPRRICIAGSWFESSNVGDNALLLSIMESLNGVMRCSYTVFTANPVRVRSLYGVPAYAPKRQPIHLFNALRSADALVFSGGAPFYDDLEHMVYFALLTLVAGMFHVPVLVFGVHMRRLRKKPCTTLARMICRKAAFVGARDGESVERFRELGGREAPVWFFPDPALTLTPLPEESARKLLAAEGVDLSSRTVAICLRDFRAGADFRIHHYDEHFLHSQIENYLTSIRRLVHELITTLNARVVFFPMHIVPPDDDRVPAEKVVERLGSERERVVVVRTQYAPREMKAMLGLMDLVVGVRLHSLILSSSMDVPTISIGYSSKIRAFVKLVGRESECRRLEEISGEWLIERARANLEQSEAVSAEIHSHRERLGCIYRDGLDRIAVIIAGK